MRHVVDDKEEVLFCFILFIWPIPDTNNVLKYYPSVSSQYDFLTQCIALVIPVGPMVLNLSSMCESNGELLKYISS